MKKIQKHIEIVRSTDGDLVSLSELSAAAVYDVLTQFYETVHVSIVNNQADLQQLIDKQPDLVFLGMKTLPNRPSVSVSGFLTDNGIEHTGSLQPAITLESDKLLAKQQIMRAGIQTAPFASFSEAINMQLAVRHMQFPMFVKPTDLGGGIGINAQSIVKTNHELMTRVKNLQDEYSSEVMAEEYLSGREFSVALLMNNLTGEMQAMPIEITPASNAQGHRILDNAAKNADREAIAVISDELLRESIGDFAKAAFIALGGRDYGRIDIRLDSSGIPHFLEANLVPGLGPIGGYFAKACRLNTGMSYNEVICAIAELGLATRPRGTLLTT